jgi:predicted glycoside hydrolase/deacetylase ChbG (UPF0249 family)
MSMTDANAKPRPIWLCADDYGMSPAVSKGIRELVAQGRLNATSVMVVAPSFDSAEAESLKSFNADKRRVAIGLHVTLTGRFQPMSAGYRPTRSGVFVSLPEMMMRGRLGLLDRKRLTVEIATQLEAFVSWFGHTPDFIDGHQHSHLAPQVREALLDVVREIAPDAWVRQCGGVPSLPRTGWETKTRILDALSVKFRALAVERGIATNPAFAGAYELISAGEEDFARLFPGFLRGLPPHSVVMCHPGFVDAELERLDPVTIQREREYAYLADEGFPALLRAHGIALA